MIEIWRRGGRTTIFLRYIFLSSSSWTLYCPRLTTSPFESRCSGQVHSAKFKRRGNRDIVARNEPYIRKLRHSVTDIVVSTLQVF